MALLKKDKQSGFSMIELSVVLIVIGLIGIGSLVYSASSIESNRISETKDKMSHIFDVMALYAREYSQMPCPAGPDLLTTDNNFGIGVGTGVTFSSPTTCTEADSSEITGGARHLVGGSVPVRTLQISPTYILDAWGRRFSYIVDNDFTYSGTGVTGSGGWLDNSPINIGDIRIRNTSTGGINITSNAVVAIVSHGSNGHGAWIGKGGSTGRINTGCSVDTDEDENAAIGGACGNFDRDFIQKMGKTDTFDDIVEYRLKWQLE